MNHEKQERHEKKKVTTEHPENTKVGFEGLVGLFEQTQTAMQRQAVLSGSDLANPLIFIDKHAKIASFQLLKQCFCP